MEEALVSFLLAAAGLSSLLSTRIHWLQAGQSLNKPYVTLTRISGNRSMNFQGANGFVESRVQVDCYGLNYGSAKQVARAVEARLSGVRVTHSGYVFRFFLDGERDIFEDADTPDKLYRVSLDFLIWHKGA